MIYHQLIWSSRRYGHTHCVRRQKYAIAQGWYEGGLTPGSDGVWSLGLATSPHPLGPWTKFAGNPILNGTAATDANRTFDGTTNNGLYIASVLHDPEYTNGEYWLYVEAPINLNDEGALALWTAERPEGPFSFKAYVLDGGNGGGWDSGRYSESRVWFHNGMFHLFVTGSAVGNPSPNKINEQLGWAVSPDGIHFTQFANNPVGPFAGQ